MASRPRVALIGESAEAFGGSLVSSGRMTSLLDDPELARTLAAHSRDRVLTQFTRERQQRAWISAYQSIGLCT